MIRIVEHNDWVIFTLIACGFVYAIMFITLLRDIRVKEFFVMDYEDASNSFLVWVLSSVVYVVVLSVFVSQFVPVIPEFLTQYQFQGYEINKMGYTLLVVGGIYFLKFCFTYLYYLMIGNGRKWKKFCFTVSRFYYGLSLVLMAGCVAEFYFDIDNLKMLKYYILIFLIVFIFKLLLYYFHYNKILPEKWYYKILYICTLQIVPLIVLWKVLFF